MSNIKSYREALVIALSLKDSQSKAATLLREKATERGFSLTRTIMQYGNPANWAALPDTPKVGKRLGSSPKGTPVTLEHIDTAVTVSAKSLTEFAAKVFGDKTKGDIVKLSLVNRGLVPHIKGWYLPATLKQIIKTQDIYGVEMTVTLRDWVKTYGRPSSTFFKLLEGRKTFASGLALASTKIKSILTPKTWRIAGLTLKNGDKEIKANSIRALAVRLGVSKPTVYPLVYGFKTDIKGYTISHVDIERKAVLQPVGG